MTFFAEGLFEGGRALRSILFVVSVATLAAIVPLPPEETALAAAVRLGIEAALALLALALLAPRRLRWAGRALCALVFLAYVAYLVGELVSSSGPAFTARRSDASPGNALFGLLLIGCPALVYALRSPRRRRSFELSLATEWPPAPLRGDAGVAAGRALVDALARCLEEAGWRVGAPRRDGDAWLADVERDGVRTELGTRIDELPVEPDDEHEEAGVVSWDVWLRRDEPVVWRDEALAAFVEAECLDLLHAFGRAA